MGMYSSFRSDEIEVLDANAFADWLKYAFETKVYDNYEKHLVIIDGHTRYKVEYGDDRKISKELNILSEKDFIKKARKIDTPKSKLTLSLRNLII